MRLLNIPHNFTADLMAMFRRDFLQLNRRKTKISIHFVLCDCDCYVNKERGFHSQRKMRENTSGVATHGRIKIMKLSIRYAKLKTSTESILHNVRT